jgi:hypothetical protein
VGEPQAVAAAHVPRRDLKIYTRSPFFYWWPVWVVGYVFALVSWFGGVPVTVGQNGPTIELSPFRSLGLLFCLVFFFVLLATNVSVRGLWSLVILLSLAFLILLFTYLDWWGPIFRVVPILAVYANAGFYLVISALVLALWLFSVLVSDRLAYWIVSPGMLTYHQVIGSGDKSYDTTGMVVEQKQQDLFRHWILGFGSGDIRISTAGARREELFLQNVLFVNSKVRVMQKLIAMKPDENEP